jgi:hypothetical protein
LLLLRAWARDGLTDEQIADKMEISRSTLYNYKKSYLDILDALRGGKEVVDVKVENALLGNATGYEYYEEVVATKKEVIYENGKRVKETITPVTLKVKRFKTAETTAAQYWLKNRKRKVWCDKPEDKEEEAPNKLELLLSKKI